MCVLHAHATQTSVEFVVKPGSASNQDSKTREELLTRLRGRGNRVLPIARSFFTEKRTSVAPRNRCKAHTLPEIDANAGRIILRWLSYWNSAIL